MTDAVRQRAVWPVKHCLIQPGIRWPFGPTTQESYFTGTKPKNENIQTRENTMQRNRNMQKRIANLVEKL